MLEVKFRVFDRTVLENVVPIDMDYFDASETVVVKGPVVEIRSTKNSRSLLAIYPLDKVISVKLIDQEV